MINLLQLLDQDSVQSKKALQEEIGNLNPVFKAFHG